MDELGGIARRFPLVARARPACPTLQERVREVRELSRAAAEQTGVDRLPLAAQAHNKAALIASDCGLPDLARSLCWRQFHIYTRGRPLGAQAARYALEPIVNLARLLIRAGDNEGGYQLLEALFQTARFRTTTTIDGTPVDFQQFTDSEEAHRTLCQWLWTVLLADGTRALAGAGRWTQALRHAEQHHGVGQRMLDGRQVAVLAHRITGDTARALTLIRESTLAEAWERPIAACLTVLCAAPGAGAGELLVSTMVDRYLELEPAPGLIVFRTRLGLAVIDLAGGVERSITGQAVARLLDEALAAEDGYVAREILGHNGCRTQLTSTQEQKLSGALNSSGLGGRAVPDDLLAAVTLSETATSRHLDAVRADF